MARLNHLLAVMLLSAAFSWSMQGMAQSSLAVDKRPANWWIKTPTMVNQWDSVSGAKRELRDQFWDSSLIATKTPLTAEDAGNYGVGTEGTLNPNSKEIPALRDRAIVTGTFKSFRSVLSKSGHSLYTEMVIGVHEVAEAPSDSDLSPGNDITLCFPGGTVETQSGSKISFLTQPRKMFLQPGRSYLLILEYRSSGDFYTLAQDWDLSGGTAHPNTNSEKMRAELGQSKISGVKADEVVGTVKRLLSEERAMPSEQSNFK